MVRMTGTWLHAHFLVTQVEVDFISSCRAALCYCCALSQIHCVALELQLSITDRQSHFYGYICAVAEPWAAVPALLAAPHLAGSKAAKGLSAQTAGTDVKPRREIHICFMYAWQPLSLAENV